MRALAETENPLVSGTNSVVVTHVDGEGDVEEPLEWDENPLLLFGGANKLLFPRFKVMLLLFVVDWELLLL